MKIKVSEKAYKTKPSTNDLKEITCHFHKDISTKELNYKQMSELIRSGHSCIFAEFKRGSNNIKSKNITSIDCIALDIDSKENPITMYEMIAIIYKKIGAYPTINYRTFSDVNYTRFRLIYALEFPIDIEVYKQFYKALQWKFKQLDQQTGNTNRIWAGTNKKVEYNPGANEITFANMLKLLSAYDSAMKRKEKKTIKIKVNEYKEINQECYIHSDYKEEVINMLIKNINLVDFITKEFGGSFKRNGDSFIGKCCLHDGDNPTALKISKDIYTCFTKCGTGNIITVARKSWNIDNFSEIALKLAKMYNLEIQEKYLVMKRGKNE